MTVLAALLSLAAAQDLDLPVASPLASVRQDVGTVEVSVTYSSPARRGRDVFGALVPYGEVWRTGANAATQLTVSEDVTIGGQPVPAGTYSLLTIPTAASWTIILNRDATTGTSNYDASKDQARFEVTPGAGPDRERLIFVFTDTDEDSATLQLEWAGLAVPLPITVDTRARGDRAIDAFVTRSAYALTEAARFKAAHGDVDAGLALIERSLAGEPTWQAAWAKAELLHQAERHKDALKAAEAALVAGNASKSFYYKDKVEAALAEWPKK